MKDWMYKDGDILIHNNNNNNNNKLRKRKEDKLHGRGGTVGLMRNRDKDKDKPATHKDACKGTQITLVQLCMACEHLCSCAWHVGYVEYVTCDS